MNVLPDHDRHVATVALTARLGTGPSPLTPAKYWRLVEQLEGDPTGASEQSDPDVVALSGRKTSAALHLSELEGQAITVLTPFHEQYPTCLLERLDDKAPPLLYAAGDIRAVARPSTAIGVVGSRNASEAALGLAAAVGQASAEAGFHTVSGGAKGVDAAGLNAAWRGGGFVAAVLAEGVRRAARRRSLRQIITEGQGAILSPVHPDAGFSVGAAMGRNKLIYALADLTVVAAATEGSGGTWTGAVEALRHGYGRVAVSDEADGADALRELGAASLRSAGDLVALLQAPTPHVRAGEQAPEQASLF